MSFRYHHTFVCPYHFTGHNHKYVLHSTIHKAYFPTVYISRPPDLLVLHCCFICPKNLHGYFKFYKIYLLKRVNFTLRQDTMNPMRQVVWCLVFFWSTVLKHKNTALRMESVAGAPIMSHEKHTDRCICRTLLCHCATGTVTKFKPTTFYYVPHFYTSNWLLKDIFCSYAIIFLWKYTVSCSHWIKIILV
jgi:hypothetical protein